jgi:CheY-like chemotaxis protein
MMPVINGFDCLEHLHQLPEERRKHYSVYMLSSTIDRNDIMRAEAYPLVKKVLEKPLDVYQLKKSVQELVEEIG